MRTTLDIQDDVLAAVREIARQQHKTAGEVISALVRQALTGVAASAPGRVAEPAGVYGFQPFAANGKLVTNEEVDALRDREGI
jgi:predicted transcriptional regulator